MRYRDAMADAAISTVDVDRRVQILDCACRVIARDGADGLRMAAVAREAGVSSALLHYYFATRGELIRLAFEHHDTRETARMHDRLSRIPDPIARVRDVLAQELSDDPAVDEGWRLWMEAERRALVHEDFRASVVDRARRWVGIVAQLVVDAQEAGRVDPDIDAMSAGLRLTCIVDTLGVHATLGMTTRADALIELDSSLRDILHLGTRREP